MGPKKRYPDGFPLKRSLLFVLGLYGAVGAVLFFSFSFSEPERAAGEGDYGIVTVSLVNNPSPSPLPSLQGGEGFAISPLVSPPSPQGGEGRGEGGEGGTSLVLQQIRNQIELKKLYPLVARRQGIEGQPILEFKIAGDGSIAYLRLTKSSGSELLDEAAKKALLAGAPYPFHPEAITVGLNFNLRDH